MPPWVERHEELRKRWIEAKDKAYIETPYEEVY